MGYFLQWQRIKLNLNLKFFSLQWKLNVTSFSVARTHPPRFGSKILGNSVGCFLQWRKGRVEVELELEVDFYPWLYCAHVCLWCGVRVGYGVCAVLWCEGRVGVSLLQG